MTRIAVLDDYQGRAVEFGEWDRLAAEVVFFSQPLTGAELIDALRGFDTIVAMRERTPFPRAVLEALPELKLLITTGMRNASFDMTAAGELGITVCGTGSLGPSTVELAWAILLAALKQALRDLERQGTEHETIEMARAAIAKAQGVK